MQDEQQTVSSTNSFRLGVEHTTFLIVPGFAVFVAFATLFGRIYFQTYAEGLRVPESEFDLSAIDYPVMSPDLAIAGFGVAASLVALAIVLSIRWNAVTGNHWLTLCSGIVLIALVAIMVSQPEWVAKWFGKLGPGLLGLWSLLPLVLWTIGTALLMVWLFSWGTDGATAKQETGSGRKARERANSPATRKWKPLAKLFATILGGSTIVQLFYFGLLLSETFGRTDAELAILEAPYVRIQLDSSENPYFLQPEDGDEGEDTTPSTVKLVHVGEKFVYIRTSECPSSCPGERVVAPGQPFQYAIPVGDIKTITYIEDP